MRRLPIFLLVDVSSSMTGEPIEAVKIGVDTLISALRQDPQALETAFLSIITFGTEAKVATPLTELAIISPPEIQASGVTAMGEALQLLDSQISSEVKTASDAGGKGDWKPLVFLLTDGLPTDDIDAGIAALDMSRIQTVVACAAGANADVDVLKKVTPNVVTLANIDASSISAFFEWVSASIRVASEKVVDLSKKESSGMDDLPPPPDEIRVAI